MRAHAKGQIYYMSIMNVSYDFWSRETDWGTEVTK